MSTQNYAQYLDEYILKHGLSRYIFHNPITVACTIKKDEPHLIKTDVIFESAKQPGEFVYCHLHQDFINVGVDSRENLLAQPSEDEDF